MTLLDHTEAKLLRKVVKLRFDCLNSAFTDDGLVNVEACKWVPVVSTTNMLTPPLESNLRFRVE